MEISNFLNSVREWAKHNDDIKSLVLVGSY